MADKSFKYDDDDDETSDCSDDNITAFEITNLSTVKKRPILKDDKKSQENWLNQLKMNSTIAESLNNNLGLEDEAIKYKNYLNNLKRNYLENLTLTTSPSSINKSSTTKRKIIFTPDTKKDQSLSLRDNIVKNSNNNDDQHQQTQLSTTQILSRLVQIREYLKQAYSMLTTLQTSNDISSYSTQLEKLNSLIDHLRDQEKGYMDLLNSIIAYQNATKETVTTKLLEIPSQQQSTIFNDDSLSSNDLSLRDLLFKIRQPPINNNSQKNISKLFSSIKQQKQEPPKEIQKQNMALKHQEQQQDPTELSYNSLVGSLISDSMNIDNEKDNTDDEEDDDNLNEIEKLKEKERLLKSIMARREEIRALEGRRKALEAIKKAALVSEKEFLNKLDENSALVLQTQTNVEKFGEVSNEEVEESEEEDEKLQKIEDMAPLHKKFQKCLKDFYSDSTGYAIEDANDEEVEEVEEEDLFDIQSMPLLATSTVEQNKDKEDLKEKLENLQEKKKQVDKLIQDLNRLKETTNLADVDEKDDFLKNYSKIKSELSQNQNQIDLIKTSVNTSSNANNTAIKAEKIINLLENQEKLEKLQSMQKRLEQLKNIVGHFNNEEAVKKMIENENQLAIKDLSEEEEEEDDNQTQFEQYKEEAKINIKHLNTLLKKDNKTGETSKITNSHEYDEQKRKLSEAKDRLKQLQDLISTIQKMPIEATLATPPATTTSTKMKINDGNKVKEVNMIKSPLNRSNISPKVELPQISILNTELPIVNQNKNNNNNNSLDLTLFSDTSLNVSPSGGVLNKSKQTEPDRTSPSDMLWSQMKQQLSLREKLRGKKKELEDMIKNERYYLYEKMNKDQEREEGEEDEEDEEEDEIEEYLYNSNNEDNNQERVYKTSNEKPLKHQQENICSPDELIMQTNSNLKTLKEDQLPPQPLNASIRSNSNLESSLVSSVIYNTNTINDLKKQLEDNNHTFECMLKNQNMLSTLLEKNLTAINSSTSSFQQPMPNYYTQPSYYMPPPPPQPQLNDIYTNHYNSQLQMQQMMMNLNAAYREITQQRSEINSLTQKIDDINRHISSASGGSSSHNSSILLNQNDLFRQREIESTYLNNYLNTKSSLKSSSSSLNVFGKDENNLKIENLKKLYNKKNYKAASRSTSTSSTLNSTQRSSSSISTARNSPVTAPNKKSTSDHIVLTSSATVTTNALPTATTITSFDDLRETIYSEVASLISQNETRPHYLLNLFRELQHLKTKNSRDQALKSIFNISSRHSTLTDVTPVGAIASTTAATLSKQKNDYDDDTVGYLRSKFDYSTDENSSVTSDSRVSCQVKQIINRVLRTLKYEKNHECVLTLEYLNELINKIISVIRHKKENHDYLRMYQSQLVSYLKEALLKYENFYLNKNLNKILFDISDILFNELTFYSIMNNSNSSFQKKIQHSKLQNEADINSVKHVPSLTGSSSNNILFVKSSPSQSSSLSSSKKKSSTFSAVTKEAFHNNSTSSETDHYTKTNNKYDDDEFEDDDVADADDDDNDYEGVTADDGDYNVDNSEEEDDEDDESVDDDDEDEENYKKLLFNIGDGSSIRKQVDSYQAKNGLFDMKSYEKYKMIDPRGGISTGSGPVQSNLNLNANDFYTKYFRNNNNSGDNNAHFIELAQSELKPYSRIGSDEDENEQDDDDEQFSDNLETAVSRQPDIAVVQEEKHHKEDNTAAGNHLGEKEIELTIDDIPEKFSFKTDETFWKNLKENELISVDQILLNSAPDDLVVDSNELLPPPQPSSPNHQIPSTDLINKTNGEEISNGYVFVNKN